MTVRSIYMSTRLVPLRNKESGVMFALMGDRASRGSEGGITGDGVTRKDVVYPKTRRYDSRWFSRCQRIVGKGG